MISRLSALGSWGVLFRASLPSENSHVYQYSWLLFHWSKECSNYVSIYKDQMQTKILIVVIYQFLIKLSLSISYSQEVFYQTWKRLEALEACLRNHIPRSEEPLGWLSSKKAKIKKYCLLGLPDIKGVNNCHKSSKLFPNGPIKNQKLIPLNGA